MKWVHIPMILTDPMGHFWELIGQQPPATILFPKEFMGKAHLRVICCLLRPLITPYRQILDFGFWELVMASHIAVCLKICRQVICSIMDFHILLQRCYECRALMPVMQLFCMTNPYPGEPVESKYQPAEICYQSTQIMPWYLHVRMVHILVSMVEWIFRPISSLITGLWNGRRASAPCS